MIVKLIFLFLAIWVGLRVYQAVQKNKLHKILNKPPQNMVSCGTCGIHLPVSEAISSGKKYYCSQDHLPKKE